MSVKFEKTGPTTGELIFTVDQDTVKEGLDKTFKRVKGQLSVPGFRKGKVPRKIFDQMYGEEALYEDTLNDIVPGAYLKALEESGVEPVAEPEMQIESMEKGQDWEMKAIVTLKPEVELGQYKDLDVHIQNREVSDELVDSTIESKRQQLAELVIKDSAAEDGDTVVIDYEGFLDGEAFEGGKDENHSLVLGSNSFIPGFEDQLIGVEPDSELEVKVTFPEDYHAEDLAGKDAVFQVKVHEVKTKEVPELDDDFAQDADDEVDTLEEYRDKVRAELVDQREAAASELVEDEAIRKAVDNAQIEEIPEPMVHEEIHRQMDIFFNNMQAQGISPDMYYQLTGTTSEDMHEQFAEDAEFRVKSNLVLEAIVEAEDIDVSEEDIQEEIKNLAGEYGLEEEAVRDALTDDMLSHDIRLKKAIDLITTTAKETIEADEADDSQEDADDQEESQE